MATVSVTSLLTGLQRTLGLRAEPPGTPSNGGTDDPFHDPLILAIGIVLLVTALAIVIATGVIHWGVEYSHPPWNTHSVPPPVTY